MPFFFFLGLNPCSTNPCKNGGVCKIRHYSYFCICPPRFGGDNCEKGEYGNRDIGIRCEGRIKAGMCSSDACAEPLDRLLAGVVSGDCFCLIQKGPVVKDLYVRTACSSLRRWGPAIPGRGWSCGSGCGRGSAGRQQRWHRLAPTSCHAAAAALGFPVSVAPGCVLSSLGKDGELPLSVTSE